MRKRLVAAFAFGVASSLGSAAFSQSPQLALQSQTQNPVVQEDKEKANQNTVLLLGSSTSSIYTEFVEDIFKTLDDRKENSLRVLPIISRGAQHNVFDILNLQGVDMGLTESFMLEHFKKSDAAKYANIDKRIHYVTKIANTEFHIVAKKDITDIRQLAGKKVDFFQKESGTAVVGQDLFKLLGIPVEPVFSFADEELRPRINKGEIAAFARASTAPGSIFKIFQPDDDLHILPIDSSLAGYESIRAKYFPAVLTSEQYPNLLPAGTSVPTIANATVLAVYAWPENTDRYRKVANFVNKFFDSIDKFRISGRHPRWREINVAAEVPGWTRFKAAQDWLNNHKKAQKDVAKLRPAFEEFLNKQAKGKKTRLTEEERDKLASEFLDWFEKQQASAGK